MPAYWPSKCGVPIFAAVALSCRYGRYAAPISANTASQAGSAKSSSGVSRQSSRPLFHRRVTQAQTRGACSAINAAGRGSCARSEEHTSELQSLMRISYAVFCLKKKTKQTLTSNKEYTCNRHDTHKEKKNRDKYI